jgi:ABC-type nickel/cobalt efflux system permease component RcnA
MTRNKNSISGLVFGAVGVAVSMLGFISATTMNMAKYDRLLYVSSTVLLLFFSLAFIHDSMHSLVVTHGENGSYIHDRYIVMVHEK